MKQMLGQLVSSKSNQTNVRRVESVEDFDSEPHRTSGCEVWMDKILRRTRIQQKPKDSPGVSGGNTLEHSGHNEEEQAGGSKTDFEREDAHSSNTK